MGDTQDKTVSVKFSLDQSSLDKARRGIQSLIDDVAKLVDITGKVSFGGLGGMGAKVSSFSGGGGKGNVATQMSQKVSSAGGGVVDGLTRAVTASSSLFKGASAGAVGSFKIMQDSLRQMVSRSEGEINRLEGSLSKLEKTYTKLKARQGSGRGGALTDAAIGQNQAEYFAGIGQLGQANAARTAFQGNLRTMNPTFGDKIGGFFGIPAGGYKPGTSPMTMLQGAAGSPAAAVTGGVALGWKIASTMASAGNSYEIGNMKYALDKPMIDLQNRASIGGAYGGMAVSLRQGQISKALAIGRLEHNGSLRNLIGTSAWENSLALAKQQNQVGVGNNLGVGSLPGAWDAAKQGIGEVYSKIGDAVHGKGVASYAGNLSLQDIAQKIAIQQLGGSQASKWADMVSKEEQSNPYQNQLANDVYGGTFSDIAGQNASRTSGNRTYNKKTKTWSIDYDRFKARQEDDMWDPGAIAAKMAQLSDMLGRGLSGEGVARKMSSLEAGGFSSAAGVYGAGSQYGGGAGGGNALIKVFQGLTGRGVKGGPAALDIGAGSMVGQLVASTMAGGKWLGGSGEDFAKIALNAAYSGRGTGGDMRNARLLPGAIAEQEKRSDGSLDRLQDAMNLSATIKAAPGAVWSTRYLLNEIPHAQLMALAQGKDSDPLPIGLAGTGITRQMIKNELQQKDLTILTRTTHLTPEMQAAKEAYIKAGGIGYLKNIPKAQRENSLNVLASAFQEGMPTGTGHEVPYMDLRTMASAAGLLDNVKGHGAWRSASKKSQQGAAAKAHAANTSGTGEDKATPENDAAIRQGLKDAPAWVRIMNQSGQRMVDALGTQVGDRLITTNDLLSKMVDLTSQLVVSQGGIVSHGSHKKAGRVQVPTNDPAMPSTMPMAPGSGIPKGLQ